jgi:hypothetical protein
MREPAWTIALIFPCPRPQSVGAGARRRRRATPRRALARDLGSGGNYSLWRSGSIPSFRQAARQAVPILWLMPTL